MKDPTINIKVKNKLFGYSWQDALQQETDDNLMTQTIKTDETKR